MKYSFIITALCGILLACHGCTPENDAYNGKGTDGNRVVLVVRATASNFDNFPVSGNPSTRTPLESGLETIFNTGDAIGIFVVKNGVIADAINNIKLTYLKTGITTGDWNPPAGTSLYWREGMDYIAYYPYKEGITIDASKTPAEIAASLAGNDKLKPQTDQSTPGKYTACDLMTAVGTVTEDAVAGSTKKILNLKFQHRFALLILRPQAHFKYVAPDNAVYTYRTDVLTSKLIVDVTAKEVTLNGVSPCKMEDGSFRAIVLPQENTEIAGNYTVTDINGGGADKALTYSGSKKSFAAGSCYTLEVKSPLSISERTRELAPGDFVFFSADNKIEIFPGDGVFEGDTIPDYKNAVGMVVTCDPKRITDAKCNEKGWKHAYAMGLETFNGLNWSKTVLDEPGLPNITTKTDSLENDMNGYSETETILVQHKDELNNYGSFKFIKEYREKKIIPDGGICSPWFLPSIGQCCDLLINIGGKSPREFEIKSDNNLETHKYGTETREKINSQLAKAGSSLGEFLNYRNIFWCSTEFDSKNAWILIWHFEVMNGVFWERVAVKAYTKGADSGHSFRPFFAF